MPAMLVHGRNVPSAFGPSARPNVTDDNQDRFDNNFDNAAKSMGKVVHDAQKEANTTIAIIVVSVVVSIGALVGGLFFLRRRNKQRKEREEQAKKDEPKTSGSSDGENTMQANSTRHDCPSPGLEHLEVSQIDGMERRMQIDGTERLQLDDTARQPELRNNQVSQARNTGQGTEVHELGH